MEEKVLEKLDAIALALHEVAYTQATQAALLSQQIRGDKACPEDFLSGNVRREAPDARPSHDES